MLRTALVYSTIVICLQSCTTTNSQRVTIAATTQGKIDAGVHLPELIADCRAQEAHAALTAGSEVRSVLIRERDALDRSNARVTRCSQFYDDTRARLATK